jgi:hypothetical protein
VVRDHVEQDSVLEERLGAGEHQGEPLRRAADIDRDALRTDRRGRVTVPVWQLHAVRT